MRPAPSPFATPSPMPRPPAEPTPPSSKAPTSSSSPTPTRGQAGTLPDVADSLAGRIVCSVVAPLEFVKGTGAVGLNVPGNSAAEEAAELLPESRVVSAFQNMPAEGLKDLDHPVEGDVLVCGDDADAKATVIGLANEIDGATGVDAGALSNSRYVELLTSLLINLNRQHKTETSIRLVGIDR